MSRSALVLLAALLLSGPGFAAQRTFVSAQRGVDGNPCSVTLPCRTFSAAIAVTDFDGEVIAVDSGGYGPTSITQSVSLIAPPGVYAGVTTTSATNGITINNAAASVSLTGLTINGLAKTGLTGIAVLAAVEVHINDVRVIGFQNRGIDIETNGDFYVQDVVARNNSGGGLYVYSASSSPIARATINRSMFVENGSTTFGVADGGYSKISVRDSIANGNANGFVAGWGGPPANAWIEMQNCEASHNSGVGVWAMPAGSSWINVSGSHITMNGVGISAAAGAACTNCVNTTGDNLLLDNATNGAFSQSFPKM